MRNRIYEIRKRIAEAMPRPAKEFAVGISNIKYRLKLEKEKFLRRDIGTMVKNIINDPEMSVTNIGNKVIENGIIESKDPSIFKTFLSRQQDLMILDSLKEKPELVDKKTIETIESSKQTAVNQILDRNRRAKEKNWRDPKFQKESYTPFLWKTVSDSKYESIDEITSSEISFDSPEGIEKLKRSIERNRNPSQIDLEIKRVKENNLLPLRVGEMVPVRREEKATTYDLIVLYS